MSSPIGTRARARLPLPRGRRALRSRRAAVATLRAAAIDNAAHGWCVFPLAAGGKLPIFHSKDRCRGHGICRDGHQGWQERATRDEAQIHRWWAGTKPWNVGIACGPSGLLIVDLDVTERSPADQQSDDAPVPGHSADPAHDAAAELARLAFEHGETLPDTFSVATPSGGRHHYFRAPSDLDLTISQGRLGPGIDTRGRGGLVVAAGSIRPDGGYRVIRAGPVADLPGWLAGLLVPSPVRPPHPVEGRDRVLSERRAHAYLATVIGSRTAEVRDATVGSRQWTLKVAARRLGQFVGGGELGEREAYRLLYDAARVHLGVEGMDHREIDATIRGGMSYGRNAPIRLGAARNGR